MPRTNSILTSRVMQVWCPYSAIGMRVFNKIDGVRPINFIEEDYRGKTYHKKRVVFFLEKILLGESLDPLIVDNQCDAGWINAQPVVLDGNHRLIAYHLTGISKIKVHYGGRLDVLRFLQGKRKSLPE